MNWSFLTEFGRIRTFETDGEGDIKVSGHLHILLTIFPVISDLFGFGSVKNKVSRANGRTYPLIEIQLTELSLGSININSPILFTVRGQGRPWTPRTPFLQPLC